MNRTAAIVYRKQLKKAQAPNEPEPAAPAPRPQLPRYRSPPTGGEVAGAVTRGLVGAVPRAIRGLYDASQAAASRVPGTEGFRQQPLEDRLASLQRRWDSAPIEDRAQTPAGRRLDRFFNRPEVRQSAAEAEQRHRGRAYPSTGVSILQDAYGRDERVPEALWRDFSTDIRNSRGATPADLRDVMGLPAHDIPLAATGPIAGHVTPRNIHSLTRAAAAALQRNPLGVLSALLQRQSQSYGPESYGKGALVDPRGRGPQRLFPDYSPVEAPEYSSGGYDYGSGTGYGYDRDRDYDTSAIEE